MFPLLGQAVVLPPPTTHDGAVTTTAPTTERSRSRSGPRDAMSVNLSPDLERFWPSRRGHAYDEFCR